jgi:hypothetical protein
VVNPTGYSLPHQACQADVFQGRNAYFLGASTPMNAGAERDHGEGPQQLTLTAGSMHSCGAGPRVAVGALHSSFSIL